MLHAGTPRVAAPGNPAAPGDYLEIYFTGLLEGAVIPPRVVVGGRLAEVVFFGGAPGYNNLSQVNVQLPAGIPPGVSVPVRLSYLGRWSNEVTVAVSGQQP